MEQTFLDGLVAEHDFIYLAAQIDALDPRRYRHTRMTGFDDLGRRTGYGDGWFSHDVELHIVSVCVKKKTLSLDRRFCALSREGDVEIHGASTGTDAIEKTPGAGLASSDASRGFVAGYVTNIREIGDSLYVCGMNGQIYRRPPEGGWLAIDGGLCKPLSGEDLKVSNYFTCIDGTNALWSFGTKDLTWFDGRRWQRLHNPSNPKIGENNDEPQFSCNLG